MGGTRSEGGAGGEAVAGSEGHQQASAEGLQRGDGGMVAGS